MRSRFSVAACLLLSSAAVAAGPTSQAPSGSQAVSNVEVENAVRRLDSYLKRAAQVQVAPPGFAVAVSTRDGPALIRTFGVLRSNGDPSLAVNRVNPDTPFYVASMTKTYVGLLAAQLDSEGVLPLSTTLAQVWPNLKLPQGADPARITLRNLLTHDKPFRNATLTFRTAYSADIPATEFERLLSDFSKAGPSGYAYDNLGYLVYAAALERRTGRSWRSWLEERVIKPLDLPNTDTRTSADHARLPWGHEWTGEAWVQSPPKPDTIMHPAGGMIASAGDLSRFMTAQLRMRAPEASAVSPTAFALARADPVPAEEQFRNRKCDGYSLGLLHCAFDDIRTLEHSGSYPGWASNMVLAPDQGVGIAVVANSNLWMTNGLVELFLAYLKRDPEADKMGEAMLAAFPGGARELAKSLNEGIAKAEKSAAFGDWSWKPAASELERYVGRYRSDQYGDVEVRIADGALVAEMGVQAFALRPAMPHVFAGKRWHYDPAWAFQFKPEGQAVRALEWGGSTFTRTGSSSGSRTAS